jgi:hypothetical protein
MCVRSNFRRSLLSLTVLACLGTSSTIALGQGPGDNSAVTSASGLRCACGRWTCPACQQQQICNPCVPGQLPYPLPPDAGASMISPDGSWDPNGPVAPPMGSSPTSDVYDSIPPRTAPQPQAGMGGENFNFSDGGAAAPAPAGPSAASLFAMNAAAGGGGGFGSSLRGATTPEMMGDFYGPGGVPSFFDRDSMNYATVIPGAGYALGRMKLAENNSPIPRDRIFFNYSLFTGVPIANEPVTVNRFSPGFEKTFLDGLASFELRTPFGSTVDNDIFVDGLNSNNEFQFGNLFLALKGVLLQKDNWLLTGGTSVLVPTAGDTRVLDPFDGREFLRIENESVHLMPFIGGAYLPSNRLFAQWMVQCDIDVNGNSVVTTENGTSQKMGTLQDFTLLYTDIAVGYWLYQAAGRQQRTITGIAPVAELHYNRSLTEADVVSDANNVVRGSLPDFDNVNIQAGLIFNLRNNARLGLGYATPLGNSFDRVFDNEFRLTFNRYF